MRGRQTRESTALVALKVVHTLIWFSVEASMMYVLYTGMRGRSDRRAGIAGAIVAGESAIFLANGARCPLTGLAESLGAESGSVTDLYLPAWLARNLPAIHVPVVILALYLHTRNIRRRIRARGRGQVDSFAGAGRPAERRSTKALSDL